MSATGSISARGSTIAVGWITLRRLRRRAPAARGAQAQRGYDSARWPNCRDRGACSARSKTGGKGFRRSARAGDRWGSERAPGLDSLREVLRHLGELLDLVGRAGLLLFGEVLQAPEND